MDEETVFGVEFGVVVCTIRYEGFRMSAHWGVGHYLVEEVLL